MQSYAIIAKLQITKIQFCARSNQKVGGYAGYHRIFSYFCKFYVRGNRLHEVKTAISLLQMSCIKRLI